MAGTATSEATFVAAIVPGAYGMHTPVLVRSGKAPVLYTVEGRLKPGQTAEAGVKAKVEGQLGAEVRSVKILDTAEHRDGAENDGPGVRFLCAAYVVDFTRVAQETEGCEEKAVNTLRDLPDLERRLAARLERSDLMAHAIATRRSWLRPLKDAAALPELYRSHTARYTAAAARVWSTGAVMVSLSLAGFAGVGFMRGIGPMVLLALASYGLLVVWAIIAAHFSRAQMDAAAWLKAIELEMGVVREAPVLRRETLDPVWVLLLVITGLVWLALILMSL